MGGTMGYVDKNLLPGEKSYTEPKLHWSFYLTPISWVLLSVALGVWGLAN